MTNDPKHPDPAHTPGPKDPDTHDTDSHDQDPWNQVIARAQTEYNPPPETPRETMWAAIQGRRRRRSRLGLVWGAPRIWVPAAAAAVLVLAFLAGRVTAPGRDAGQVTEQVPGSIDTPSPDGLTAGGADPARDDAGMPTPVTAEDDALPDDSGTDLASGDAAPPEAADGGGPAVAHGPDAAYRLATASFLNRTETMLTRFQNSAAGESRGADTNFAQWARTLLSETRLLIDSPAAQDAETLQLLGDLETLLAQLVMLADERQAGQRTRIAQNMDRSGILLRVRNQNTRPYQGI